MNLAPLDTQIDPIDRDESAELLGEAFCLQDCVIHVRCTGVDFYGLNLPSLRQAPAGS